MSDQDRITELERHLGSIRRICTGERYGPREALLKIIERVDEALPRPPATLRPGERAYVTPGGRAKVHIRSLLNPGERTSCGRPITPAWESVELLGTLCDWCDRTDTSDRRAMDEARATR